MLIVFWAMLKFYKFCINLGCNLQFNTTANLALSDHTWKCHCVWLPCVFTLIALAPAGPGLLVLPAGDARGDPAGQEGADRSGGGAAVPSVRDGGVARAGRAGRAASRVRSLQ